MPPEFGPHCGAGVPRHAKACPHCGSCDATGWSDKAAADRLDLPDDSFDCDAFVKEGFDPPERFGFRHAGSLLRFTSCNT